MLKAGVQAAFCWRARYVWRGRVLEACLGQSRRRQVETEQRRHKEVAGIR